jgi:hypothetical protein
VNVGADTELGFPSDRLCRHHLTLPCGSRFVDHALEVGADADTLAGCFGFDPSSSFVIEADAENGGLG